MEILRGQTALAAIERLRSKSPWVTVAANPQALAGENLLVLALSDGAESVLVDPISSPTLGQALAKLPLVATYRAKEFHRVLLREYQCAPSRWACIYLSELLLASGRAWDCSLAAIAPRYGLASAPDPEAGITALADYTRTLHGLVEKQVPLLKAEGLQQVSKLEASAVAAVASMEHVGVPFDAAAWQKACKALQDEHADTEKNIWEVLARGPKGGPSKELFGHGSLASDPQLKAALHAAGYSVPNVRKETLEQLASPLGGLLKRFRELGKLQAAYGEGFLSHVGRDGRIHPTFEQIGASTGRMACRKPNLQAMVGTPAQRECFRPAAHRRLVIADYSTCELRILAEMSGDPVFLNAFAAGEDLHARVATSLFGKPVSKKENPELRHKAKAVNFGLVYGMGAAGLARSLGLGKSAAQTLLEDYFRTFPSIRSFLEDLASTARRTGEARTLTGRRLIFEAEHQQGGLIDRLGKNMPIQGTSADIIKLALARLHRKLAAVPDAHLVNVVHDEILVECPAEQATEVAAMTRAAMQEAGASVLKQVPLEAEAIVAQHWQK